MNLEITVRQANPSDAAAAARLIYLTMGPLADYLLGLGDPARVLAVLGGLFGRPRNRFSYQFTDLALVSGDVAGLLTSYPEEEMRRLDLGMGRQMMQILGMGDFLRFVRRSLTLANLKEATVGEYFIHSVAVLPQFRWQGIATRLMALAEARARQHGLDRCSLSVEVDNDAAHKLHERLGY
jgi:ribosomal protein S18 acetylase RimI-like enzyme